MAQLLKNDAELLTFPTQHENSVVIVLANWCRYCVEFKATHLEGVENAFHVAGVPLGLADHNDLSPQMRMNKELIPSYPTILFFGQRGGFKERYIGERTPAALLAWARQNIKQMG